MEAAKVAILESRLNPHPINDDKLVRVYLKIRDARTKLSKEYDVADANLKAQLDTVAGEIMRRLIERGSTQTKTPDGTAFFGEDMSVTIADEDVFRTFVLEAKDLNWYQKRVKVEHLREYMKANEGRLPPGLSIFRERTVLVRSPRRAADAGAVEMQEFEQPNAAAAAQQE